MSTLDEVFEIALLPAPQTKDEAPAQTIMEEAEKRVRPGASRRRYQARRRVLGLRNAKLLRDRRVALVAEHALGDVLANHRPHLEPFGVPAPGDPDVAEVGSGSITKFRLEGLS